MIHGVLQTLRINVNKVKKSASKIRKGFYFLSAHLPPLRLSASAQTLPQRDNRSNCIASKKRTGKYRALWLAWVLAGVPITGMALTFEDNGVASYDYGDCQVHTAVFAPETWASMTVLNEIVDDIQLGGGNSPG